MPQSNESNNPGAVKKSRRSPDFGQLLQDPASVHRGNQTWTLYAFLLAYGIWCVDQISKMVVEQSQLVPGMFVNMVDWMDLFNLTYVKNPGAAWGLFPGFEWLFIATAVIVSLVFTWSILRTNSWQDHGSSACILGGALGNMTDRMFLESGVVDFIDIGIYSYRWPTFNVADIALTIGLVWLTSILLFDGESDSINHHTPTTSG